jgi:hypothetical protein
MLVHCLSDRNAAIRPGDLVEVKAPDEILLTLDADGTLDHVPFMPEMVEFCGKRFEVSKWVATVCPGVRGFRTNDVFFLDGLRCSGAAHEGCQKACMILWRQAWLRKVDGAVARSSAESGNSEQLRARLKTLTGPKRYFCQASELFKATVPLSRGKRIGKYLREVRLGNFTALQMAHRIAIFMFWRIRGVFLGLYGRGNQKSTPSESLNLKSGEWVEVKSADSIIATLNEKGHNRGMRFSQDMRLLCGQRRRVMGRVERIVVDGTGEMRQVQNTVCLEGSICGCAHLTCGGCSREEIVYWREIWLRRAANP